MSRTITLAPDDQEIFTQAHQRLVTPRIMTERPSGTD